jgi:hypothetical protein
LVPTGGVIGVTPAISCAVSGELRIPLLHRQAELSRSSGVIRFLEEDIMGFGRGALLWLLGVPLPIILLLALFWHH